MIYKKAVDLDGVCSQFTDTYFKQKKTVIAVGLLATALVDAPMADEIALSFSINSQSASSALIALGEQADITILIQSEARDIQLPELQGTFTFEEAINNLLKGSGLIYRISNGAIIVNLATEEQGINRDKTKKNKVANMKKSKSSIFAAVSAALLSVFAPVDAIAQDSESNARPALEEIFVTAQKRSESIQDVPIAMTALAGDSLRELGVKNSQDLAAFVPNMEWADNGTHVPSVFIRGVGDTSFHLNQVGGVGLYMDEVSLNSPILGGFALFDLERIEVLRGPQNSLFGRNTTGGAVQFISNKPSVDDGTNGHLEFSYNSIETFDAEGAVGFALSDTVAVRLAASGTVQGNWMENITLNQDQGEGENFALRGQLTWQASDNIDVLLNIHGGAKDRDTRQAIIFGSRDPANPGVVDPSCVPKVGNGCSDSVGFVPPGDFDKTSANFVGKDTADVHGGFLSVNWELPSVTISSVTSFDHSEAIYVHDNDGGPRTTFYTAQEADVDQWSQEIRVASATDNRFRWIGGLYYFEEEADWTIALRFTPPPLFAAFGPQEFGPQLVPYTIVPQENKVWSTYGQGEFDLTDKLTITAGLRYSRETKEAEVTGGVGLWFANILPADSLIGFDEIALLPPGAPPVPTGLVDETWEELGGKIAIDYQYSDDVLLYGGISRGFKGGGTSLAALESLVGQPGRVVDPESLISYELGAKTTWQDGALQLNGAIYYNSWKDQQLFTTFVSGGITSTFLVNVPESRSYGAEFELSWVPAAGWFVSSGLGFIDAQVEKSGSAFPGLAEGNTLPNSPDVTFNGLISKEWQLANGLLTLMTNFNYKDDVLYNINEDPVVAEESYWLLNVRASYRFGAQEEYEIAVFGENLTDTEYCIDRLNLQDAAQFGGHGQCYGNFGEPIFGASASFQF